MSEPRIHPPQWPLRALRFFVRKKYLEEIEGDMEEIFRDHLERYSPRKARWLFMFDTLKLMRPILIGNFEGVERLNHYGMLKNYFKVSIRGLLKNPLSSFINVFGLALAIGLCILAYSYAQWTFRTDQFHVHKDKVYMITMFTDRDGTSQEYGFTPRPLGEVLRQDFPQIKKVCRVEDGRVVVKHLDNVYHERLRYVDPEFLEMFTFPLKWGTSSTLRDINSIMLSEEMSEKYFGEENPVGQTIMVRFDKDNGKEFKVTGVFERFPDTSTIEFSFLVNFGNLKTAIPGFDSHDWVHLVKATFIQVENPADLAAIGSGIEKYRKMQNEAVSQDWEISSFAFQRLATLHERAAEIKEDISRGSTENFKGVIFLTLVGVFMLTLACLNYINIAIVSATKRLKEIGVRKSIGATRKVVIIQFLSENVIVSFSALPVGLFLGVAGFIPWFEKVNAFRTEFSLGDPVLWIFLPAVLLITGIASGAYPAFYISKFQVAGILKGSVRFGTRNRLTKVFLGVQVLLACMFISTAVFFTQNSEFMTQRPWGYKQEQALYAIAPDELSLEQLRAVMSRNADVLLTSASTHHLGKAHNMTVMYFGDREYEVDQILVDANYFETMGIELKEGRFFNDHEGSDKQAIIVNETLVKTMGWQNPTNEMVKINDVQYAVVGVVKDFHNYSFSRLVTPTFFSVGEKKDARYLSLKVAPGSELKTYKALQDQWAKLFPEVPFAGGMQQDVWGRYFEFIQGHGSVWQVIAAIAVALATLGLYGLMTLNIAGRVREFSIRKVLGAGVKNIAGLITKQYVLLFAAGLAIGSPVSFFLNRWLFDIAYRYHMPIGFSGIVVAVVLLVLVLVITVATRVSKVHSDSVVEGLKVE